MTTSRGYTRGSTRGSTRGNAPGSADNILAQIVFWLVILGLIAVFVVIPLYATVHVRMVLYAEGSDQSKYADIYDYSKRASGASPFSCFKTHWWRYLYVAHFWGWLLWACVGMMVVIAVLRGAG